MHRCCVWAESSIDVFNFIRDFWFNTDCKDINNVPGERKFHFASCSHPLLCCAEASKQVSEKISPDKSRAEIQSQARSGCRKTEGQQVCLFSDKLLGCNLCLNCVKQATIGKIDNRETDSRLIIITILVKPEFGANKPREDRAISLSGTLK